MNVELHSSLFNQYCVVCFSTTILAIVLYIFAVLQFLYAGCLCHSCSLCPLLLGSSLDRYVLHVGTQTNLLAYDIKDTRDIWYKSHLYIHVLRYACTMYMYMCTLFRYMYICTYMYNNMCYMYDVHVHVHSSGTCTYKCSTQVFT